MVPSDLTEKIYIGFIGSFGSGCTTVANFLFKHLKELGKKVKLYTLSDYVKTETAKEKKNPTRRDYQDMGDQIRAKEGPSFLADKTIARILERDEGIDVILIDSFKNTAEVNAFQKFSNFYLMNVDAPREIRWQRLKEKQLYLSKDAFLEEDKRDNNSGNENGQQVSQCVDLADIVINNDKELEDKDKSLSALHSQVKLFAKLILFPGSMSPTPLEVYMTAAYMISLSSSCLKRKVGSVITKGANILASGFNDPPEGLSACKDLPVTKGKCYRDYIRECTKCKTYILPKNLERCNNCGDDIHSQIMELTSALHLCRAVHAEERAILQIARLGGISLQDSALYTTTFPCKLCAKKIVETKIGTIVYVEPYPTSDSIEILKQGGVEMKKFEGVKSKAYHKLYKS